MPTEPTKPAPSAGDADLHERMAKDLEQLQVQLAELDARRRAQLEAERLLRAERTAAAEAPIPGIPE
jgi:hypothetical protein